MAQYDAERLTKHTITAVREYFTLGGCAGPGRPIHTYEQREQATKIALRDEYFTLGGCTGPGRPIHTYEQRDQATITA